MWEVTMAKRLAKLCRAIGLDKRPHEHHAGVFRSVESNNLVIVWRGANGLQYRHEFDCEFDGLDIPQDELDLVRVKVAMSLC